MRKRRVGVIARSRLIVGNQATGTPQIATEIAAPLVSRTPTGTVATATSECGWKRGDTTGVKDNRAESSSGEMRIREESRTQGRRTSAPKAARMRRCLILRQGASPLRPPAPFPSGSRFQNGGNLSRVRKPRNNGAPLTNSLRSEDATEMRERGPSAKRAVGRVVRGGTARYARMRRCLILRQGAKPPETLSALRKLFS
jgi:hypothetical protein